MYLIQILLPVYDNEGNKFEAERYIEVRVELTKALGGSTAYSRAPAEGLGHDAGTVKKDDIVIQKVVGPVPKRAGGAIQARGACRSRT